MVKLFALFPGFSVSVIFSTLARFLFIHLLFWVFIGLIFNHSYCWQENIIKSEVVEIFATTSCVLITLGLVGFSLKSLLFSSVSVSDANTLDITNSSAKVKDVILEVPAIKILEVPFIKNEEVDVVANVEVPELFKFVEYKLNRIPQPSIDTITNFVDPLLLQNILIEIEAVRNIVSRYEALYVKQDNPYLDQELIYQRFQWAKDQFDNFSHERRFGDWFHASSVLDPYENSITQLMLALKDKPTECINGLEQSWDFEVWKSYMFQCRKNFWQADDVLNYAEILIQRYLHEPEAYNIILPTLHSIPVPDKVEFKIIYLWDEMVKAGRLKKETKRLSDSTISLVEPEVVVTDASTISLVEPEVVVTDVSFIKTIYTMLKECLLFYFV